VATYAVPDRCLWMLGRTAEAETWLDDLAAQFTTPAPETPQPLLGYRTTPIGSSGPPEGWPRDDFDTFTTRLRRTNSVPRRPTTGLVPSGLTAPLRRSEAGRGDAAAAPT
jgi:hypothetical protein